MRKFAHCDRLRKHNEVASVSFSWVYLIYTGPFVPSNLGTSPTPRGTISIDPIGDELIKFWSDKLSSGKWIPSLEVIPRKTSKIDKHVTRKWNFMVLWIKESDINVNDVSLNIKSFKKRRTKKAFGSWVIVVCFVDDKQDLGQE